MQRLLSNIARAHKALDSVDLPLHFDLRSYIRSYVRPGAKVAVAFTIGASLIQLAHAAAIQDLSNLSLEELSNVSVTSVSKSAQPLRQAAAAVYVITRDEILRSGATSIAEVLRLAPNLSVTQLSSSNYVATARGFASSPDAQNFANKLLVLIDGRSVYTPLFSGLYLDVQDVVLSDIDRIEVISGPGATLWGANAMNGVINIITRSAHETTGNLVNLGAGDQEQKTTLRHGGNLNDELAFRIYGKAFHRGALELEDESSAHDGWSKFQGGFRLDWQHAADTATVQGDLYHGTENQLGLDDLEVAGGNLLANWQHHGERSDLQVKAYVDQTQRSSPPGGVAFVLHTYDLEIQQSFALGSANQFIWGVGERVNSYGITNSDTLLFVPAERSLTLANLFAHDTFSIGSSIKIMLGMKMEDDPYYGWSPLPDVRISWQVSDTTLLWAAASRAIRSPTPFDQDVVEKLGGTLVFLTGNQDFRPERVNAYEIGYRGQPSADLSLSASIFYNVYDDLRSIETASSTTFIPLHWGNQIEGNTYGIEAWATWQVAPHWRLSPSIRTLRKDLKFKPGASGLLGVEQAGNDPSEQASLKSSLDIGNHMTFDAVARYVGDLPSPKTASYYELNARFGWQLSKTLEISLSGFNLLHPRHLEFATPNGEYISRSVFAGARWTF